MKKLLISILLVLSCTGQAFALGGILGGVMGNVTTSAESTCSSGTYTGGVDWATGTTNNSGTQVSTSNYVGQSFSTSANGTLYSLVLPAAATNSGNTLTCRVGSSSDLATYMVSGSVSTGDGDKEIVFSTHPSLLANTTYYFACTVATDSPSEYFAKSAESYTNGTQYTGSGWSNLSSQGSNNLRFGIKLCQ